MMAEPIVLPAPGSEVPGPVLRALPWRLLADMLLALAIVPIGLGFEACCWFVLKGRGVNQRPGGTYFRQPNRMSDTMSHEQAAGAGGPAFLMS